MSTPDSRPGCSIRSHNTYSQVCLWLFLLHLTYHLSQGLCPLCVITSGPVRYRAFFIFKINFKNYLELSLTSVYICGMATKNTRIDASVLERVNDHIGLSGQPASVFISIAATKMLDDIQGKQSVKTKYFSEMGEFLMKEISKKKK